MPLNSPLPNPTRPLPGATPPPEPPMDEFELYRLLEPEAQKHGLPMDLLLRQVRQESRGRVRAVSPKGAKGLMQLMDPTAAAYGVTDPFDPVQNVRGGVAHMASLWKKHKGDRRAVLAEYNGGAAAVDALRRGTPWKETAGYLQAIEGGGATPYTPSAQPPPAPPSPADEFEQFRAGETPLAQGVIPPTLPGPGNGPPAPPPSPTDYEIGGMQRLGLEVGSAFDPLERSGRRNLAGTGGAIVATAGAGAALGGPPGALAGALIGAAGAGIGGAVAEAAEQTVAGEPPSPMDVAKAGTEQAVYDIAGSALLWPVKALGKRLIASPVSKRAYEGLQKTREATIGSINQAIDSAKTVLRGVRETATRALEDTRGLVREEVGSVVASTRARAAGAIAGAERQAAEGVAKATEPFTKLTATPPPSAADIGKQAIQVARGPAQTAREQVGRAVEEAAENGPDVDIRAFKAKAQAIVEKEAQPVSVSFPQQAAEGLPVLPDAAKNPEARAILEAAMQEGQQQTLRHPAMRVLTQILNAPDSVPFKAAHQFKRELDDALLGQWDKAEKKRVASVTQGLRDELSAALQAHKPYAKATAAYAAIIPLYTKGYGAQLKRIARDQPEALVRMISPKDPTKVGMLRELLVDQAAAGGDAKGGQAAWDAVRSRWTHDKVLTGGLEGLGERLDKLPPDFVEAFYGDATGQQVWLNLKAMAGAYQDAVAAGKLIVAQTTKEATERAAASQREARGVGAALLATTRRAGRMDVRAAEEAVIAGRRAKAAAQAPTAEETRFFASSLAPDKVVRPEYVAADVARGATLGPQSVWGGISVARLILHGPKAADLLEWAAYSPTHTRLIVQALTSPYPDQALATALRSTQALERMGLAPQPSHPQTVSGTRPPGPRASAAPTPPPRP